MTSVPIPSSYVTSGAVASLAGAIGAVAKSSRLLVHVGATNDTTITQLTLGSRTIPLDSTTVKSTDATTGGGTSTTVLFRQYALDIAVTTADSGATLTVTFSATTRAGMNTCIVPGILPAVSALAFVTTGTVAMPLMDDRGGSTILTAMVRQSSSAAPAITGPPGYRGNTASAVTNYTTGGNVSTLVAAGLGGGNGSVAASGSDRLFAYTWQVQARPMQIAMRQANTGAGCTSASMIHPLNGDFLMVGADTAAPESSFDGGQTWNRTGANLYPSTNMRSVGLVGDPIVANRVWGSQGSLGNGGLWYSDSGGPWTLFTTPSPVYTVEGGRPQSQARAIQTDDQPRQASKPQIYSYGPNYRLIIGATSTSGVVLAKQQMSDGTNVAQSVLGGTSGYAQCVQLLKNMGSASGTYDTVLLASLYDQRTSSTNPSGSGPLKLMRCLDISASSPTATALGGGAPSNVEGLAFCLGSAAGALPVTLAVGNGYVMTSTDVQSATVPTWQTHGAPNSIAPMWWTSALVVESGNNYVALVGCYYQTDGSGSNRKSMYRGVWAQNASPSTATWTAEGPDNFGSTFPDGQTNPLDDASRAGNPGSVITSLSWSPAKPNRVLLSGRVQPFLSDDLGQTWVPMESTNRAGGFGHFADPRPNVGAGIGYLNSVDYPLWWSGNQFTTLPSLVLSNRTAGNASLEAASGCVDSRTGDVIVNLSTNAGTSGMPTTDSASQTYWISASDVSKNGLTIGSFTQVGTNPFASGSSTLRPRAGGYAVGYGGSYPAATSTRANRTILMQRQIGDGFQWYNANNPSAGWQQITTSTGAGGVVPGATGSYVASNPTSNAYARIWDMEWHEGTGNFIAVDRSSRFVWRFPLNDDGSVGTPTPICRFPTLPYYEDQKYDICGRAAINPGSPQGTMGLILSSTEGVWRIPDASIVSATDMSVATKIITSTTSGSIPCMARFTRGHLLLTTFDQGDASNPPKVLLVTGPMSASPTVTDLSSPATQGQLGALATGDVWHGSVHPADDTGILFAVYGGDINGGSAVLDFADLPDSGGIAFSRALSVTSNTKASTTLTLGTGAATNYPVALTGTATTSGAMGVSTSAPAPNYPRALTGLTVTSGAASLIVGGTSSANPVVLAGQSTTFGSASMRRGVVSSAGGSITVTIDLTNNRVGVTLGGFPADGDVTVYRIHANGDTYPVRDLDTISGGAAFAWDYEAPTDQPFYYQAFNGSAIIQSDIVTLPITTPLLSVPGLPAYVATVTPLAKPSLTWARPSKRIGILGRPIGITLYDVQQSPTFPVVVRTYNRADTSALGDTLTTNSTMLLRMPGTLPDTSYAYVTIIDVTRTPFVPYIPALGAADNDPAWWYEWSLGCEVTDRPEGDSYGDPTTSYQVLLNSYGTYQQIVDSASSYLDLLRGV